MFNNRVLTQYFYLLGLGGLPLPATAPPRPRVGSTPSFGSGCGGVEREGSAPPLSRWQRLEPASVVQEEWSGPGPGRAVSGRGRGAERAPRGPRGPRAGHVPHDPGANSAGAGARARGAGGAEGRSHQRAERCPDASRSAEFPARGSGRASRRGAASPRECEPGDLCFIDVGRADGKPAVVVLIPGALGAEVTA